MILWNRIMRNMFKEVYRLFVLLCTICDHLHSLKNLKKSHWGVLPIVEFQAEAFMDVFYVF